MKRDRYSLHTTVRGLFVGCALLLLVSSVAWAGSEASGSASVTITTPMLVSSTPFAPMPAPVSPAVRNSVDLAADIVPVELEPLDLAAIAAEDEALPTDPLRVGVSRPLGIMSTDAWAAFRVAPGVGSFSATDVRSPEARALRLKLSSVDLPEGVELWIYSPNSAEAVDGPYVNRGPGGTGEIWTSIIPGDTVRVECFVPEDAAGDGNFVIEELQHIYRGLGDPAPTEGGVTTGSECYLDVMCYPDWQPLHNATAHIYFTESDGTYICSGTLLNTLANDGTPYFMTANHCVSNNTVGATVVAYWFYQTQSCDGTEASYIQTGYTHVVWTSGTYDMSLLMFEGRLPSGVTWAGWDNAAVTNGTDVVGISHPGGRHKKISFGDKILHPWGDTTHYLGVTWTNGTIEGGSSGSGLYRASNQGFIGVASHSTVPMGCDNPAGPSGYGRFQNMYNSVATLLQAGSDDAFYGNQTCATARLVGAGVYSNLVIKRIASDWFKIVLNPCDQLDLTMSHTNSWGDLDIQFFDACGGNLLVERTGGAGNKTFTYVNEGDSAHTYYLNVYAGDGDSDTRNTYDLTVGVASTGSPLAAPTNVQASDGVFCDEVAVTWSASAGATTYFVWRATTDDSAAATQIGTSAVPSYTDGTTANGVTYYYWIKAANDQPCSTSAFSASNSGYSDCGVTCPGDLNGDNVVNLSDLAQLLGNYGIGAGAAYEDGDLDGDGDVDLSDLASLLGVYGVTCP